MPILTITLLLTALTAAAAAPPQAPAWSPGPSADCSALMLDLIGCARFLEEGEPETKPAGSCCSGLKKVLGADPECVCYALRSSGSMGIHVNMSRAEGLPGACGVSAPPISKCHVSLSPSTGSPVPVSPSGSPVSASPSGSPVYASPSKSPVNSPVNAPSSNYPTLAPPVPAFVPSPTPTPTTTATGEAPAPTRVAPAAARNGVGPGPGPGPEVPAPSPSNSGARIVPVTFLVVVGYFLVAF